MPATVHPLRKEVEHEYLTIPEFAARVRRSRKTVYGWIRSDELPKGSVVDIQGSLRIDWDVFRATGIRPVK